MILDTTAVSALFAGDPKLAAVLGANQHHHLPVVVIGEYSYGLVRSRLRAQLQALLDALARESIVLDVDRVTARCYADVREELRRNGTPIPENDIWIAALARQHGEPVVSRDEHFDLVPKVQRVSW